MPREQLAASLNNYLNKSADQPNFDSRGGGILPMISQRHAEAFLNVLHGTGPGMFSLCTIGKPLAVGKPKLIPRGFFRRDEIPKAINLAMKFAPNENVYVSIGMIGQVPGPGRRGLESDVVCINSFWADIDFADECHKQKFLPPTLADARQLASDMGLEPSIVVHSGHGIQCQWLYQTPAILNTPDDVKRERGIQILFRETLKAKARARGWTVDSVADLARVFRLPGTINHNGKEPLPVRITEWKPDRLYIPEDFHPFFVAPEPEKKSRPVVIRTEPSADDSKIIGLVRRGKWESVWGGSLAGHASHSHADLALIGRIAFFTGPDPDRIDRIFRASGLVRGKWIDRDDYRNDTIELALKTRTEFFHWSNSQRPARSVRTVTLPRHPQTIAITTSR